LAQALGQFGRITVAPCLVDQADLDQIPEVCSIFVPVSGQFDLDERGEAEDPKIAAGFAFRDVRIGQRLL